MLFVFIRCSKDCYLEKKRIFNEWGRERARQILAGKPGGIFGGFLFHYHFYFHLLPFRDLLNKVSVS